MASPAQGNICVDPLCPKALTMLQRTELLSLEDVKAYLGSMAISEGGLSEVPEDDSNDEFS